MIQAQLTRLPQSNSSNRLHRTNQKSDQPFLTAAPGAHSFSPPVGSDLALPMNGDEFEGEATGTLKNEALRCLLYCIEPDERRYGHSSEHRKFLWHRKLSP